MSGSTVDPRQPPSWDDARANELVGMLTLVGITHLDAGGELSRMEQFFGHVASTDRSKGIELKLAGSRDGDRFVLPPDLTLFQDAAPGDYSLKSTGETVRDPNYLVTVTIHAGRNG